MIGNYTGEGRHRWGSARGRAVVGFLLHSSRSVRTLWFTEEQQEEIVMASALRATNYFGRTAIKNVSHAYRQTNKNRVKVVEIASQVTQCTPPVVTTTSPGALHAKVSPFAPSFGGRVTGIQLGQPGSQPRVTPRF